MESTHEMYKYIHDTEGIRDEHGYYISVRFNDITRHEEAKKQADKAPVSIDKVIEYSNEFLQRCGISPIANPIVINPEDKLRDSEAFYNNMGLNDRRDIIWMKFTEDGFLGVVAKSDDINFSLPSTKNDYRKTNDGKKKSAQNEWMYNSSGIIIHQLGKSWCKKHILVFPLKKIPDGLTSGDIECGIGNYLSLVKGVPILDYYSHRF